MLVSVRAVLPIAPCVEVESLLCTGCFASFGGGSLSLRVCTRIVLGRGVS